jgi:hypothetical protein
MIGFGFLMGAFVSIPIFSLVNIFMPENIPLMYSPLLIFAIINTIAGIGFYLKVDEDLTFEKYDSSLIKTNDNDTLNNNDFINNSWNDDRKSRVLFYMGFTALILAILLTSMNVTIYSPFITAYLIEYLLPDMSERLIPIIVMIVYFPAQVISQLVASKLGKVFDRVSPHISVIFIGFFKAFMIWWLISAFSAIDYTIILIFLSIATEANKYFIQAIMSRISIKHRGKIFGLNMWVDRLGRVIGPLIGGILWDTFEYNIPFIISIYIGLFIMPIIIFAIRKLSPYMVEQV